MKTLCAWDNVACIVDNGLIALQSSIGISSGNSLFPQSLDSVILPFVVIIGAIIGACVVANLASKKE